MSAVPETTATTVPAAELSATSTEPTSTTTATETAAEPITAETGAETAATTSAASPVEATKESINKNETKIEAQPIAEGVLSYKGPGLLKNLLYNKKFFWFGNEPLSHESLGSYLRAEKDEIAHHNVAHASETGKGLLFYSKRAEDKATPEGVINLADATDVTREPTDRFVVTVHGKKHNFHAPTRAECESWIVAVETGIREAVANKDTVMGSENYKNTKSKLGRSALAGGAIGAAAGTAATTDKVHDGATPATITTTAATEKPVTSKSRSQSRKRASIFGNLLGKKDEKSVERANEKEIQKEEKVEAKEIKKEEKAEATEIKAEEKAAETASGDAKFHQHHKAEEVAAIATGAPVVGEAAEKVVEPSTTGAAAPITEGTAPVVSENAAPATTGVAAPATVTSTTTPPTTNKSKRSSVFGFFGKKSGDVPTTKDVAAKETIPPVPAKDISATSSIAPQLDPVDTTTGTTGTTAVTTEAEPAAAATTDATTGAAVAGTEHVEPSSNPLAPVEETAEAKAANKQKEGGDLFSFMKKKKLEHEDKKAIDSTAEGTAAAEKTEFGTTGATSPATERRRSSFFNSLSGRGKDRGTSPEGEKKGLGGLFRSKSKKTAEPVTAAPVTDTGVPPNVPKKETAAEGAVPATTVAETAPATTTVEGAPATTIVDETPAAATTGTEMSSVTEPTAATKTTV